MFHVRESAAPPPPKIPYHHVRNSQSCYQDHRLYSVRVDILAPLLFLWVFPCCSRWWAWTLIKDLTPEEKLQIRAKVATLEALKGQRPDLGLQRTWEGNYLKRDSPDTASSFTLVSCELQRKDKFMRVLFSCNVRKINRFHKAEDRAVLITDRHLYKMDPLKQYKPMKSIPLYNVRAPPLCG
ncbi:unnamed protein product [Oncorhynchus mykiss]|uniref:TH1 domain-containing protein n=1 Tax=Oncorhynchus mykiss TaxID=8022 RepID=A0A060Z993_ONCMY|nr:unnamed protein product [Oncorhynchus mykiss]